MELEPLFACNLACADYIEYVLEKEGDVAAVIGETVRCTPFLPPPEYRMDMPAPGK